MAQPDLAPRRIGRPPSCTCGQCRKCQRAAYMRAWWNKHSVEEKRRLVAQRDPERIREVEKARGKSPEKQASVRRSQQRHPERLRARRATHTALANGTLAKKPCAICGAEKVEAHHPDYSKPLAVVWLCRRHHADRHMVDAEIDRLWAA